MKAFSPKVKGNKEAKIQDAIRDYLEKRGWFVIRMAASMYMSGVPDLWATHKSFHERFIEVKLPNMEGSKFTPAQLETFPQICAHGSGVWILTAATETEYLKLFDHPNWHHYLKL